jgi:hypothetical protein
VSKLSEQQIQAWVETDERFEMRGDGGGLYLCFPPRLTRPAWAFRCRQDGEQHKLRLGHYPDMPLDQARELAAGYRRMIEESENVIGALANKRAEASEKELARTFSALLREAARHGAKRMTVTVEFEAGETTTWAP